MAKIKEHSVQVREKVVQFHMKGEGYDKISMRLDIPKSTVRAIIEKHAAEGHILNKMGRGRKRFYLRGRKYEWSDLLIAILVLLLRTFWLRRLTPTLVSHAEHLVEF